MTNINELVLIEQNQTLLDQKIKNIQAQNNHLSQLLPLHKNNINNKDKDNNKNKVKLFQLPTRKDIKMANHFEKMASKITDFSKPLI